MDKALLDDVQHLINRGGDILTYTVPHPKNGEQIVKHASFRAFRSAALSFIENTYTTSHPHYSEFNNSVVHANFDDTRTAVEFLKVMKDEIEHSRGIFKQRPAGMDNEPIFSITRICNKFHTVAHQLTIRHASRPTLTIADEYDVQDLLHTLLLLYFDDIQPEDYIPSYGGTASRLDFALRQHEIVIEVKKTRSNLKNQDITDQLIIDTARYRNYPYCKHLFCFVYDPDNHISNPRGLERDLSGRRDDVNVIVLVRPRH